MKTEVTCKECGMKFVKYSCSRMARCEECRKGAVVVPVSHAGNAREAGKRLQR